MGLRAVTTTDGMTPDFYPFDMKFLGDDVTRKPPGKIEWERGRTISDS